MESELRQLRKRVSQLGGGDLDAENERAVNDLLGDGSGSSSKFSRHVAEDHDSKRGKEREALAYFFERNPKFLKRSDSEIDAAVEAELQPKFPHLSTDDFRKAILAARPRARERSGKHVDTNTPFRGVSYR